MSTHHNPASGETPSQGAPQETLSERSARLEAEAKAFSENTLSAQGESAADTSQGQNPLPPSPDNTAELQQQLDAMRDQMIRAVAEADNIRKRAVKEREDTAKYAIASFARDLLDVSDNLRRALEAMPTDLLEQDPRLKNLIDGIGATERTLLKTFEKHGITRIDPLHEIFNPNYHEVMFEAPLPGKQAGTVIQILESGYLLHDRLLRPARVGVVKDDGAPPSPLSGGHIDTQA